jgi:hypothetical protein
MVVLTVYSYIAAYLPSTSEADRRHPDISPFYANLRELKCQCVDGDQVDDEWRGCGVEALSWYVITFFNGLQYSRCQPANHCGLLGAAHGFVFFPIGGTPETQKALDDIKVFVQERL